MCLVIGKEHSGRKTQEMQRHNFRYDENILPGVIRDSREDFIGSLQRDKS